MVDETLGAAHPFPHPAEAETVAHLRAWVVDQQIIKRSEEPADLAGTVVFLASANSDFITGQTINVNGEATHH